jgi:mRNA interferase MazF
LARFVKGDVVVVPFPFSDLTQSKRRPALVIAELTGKDIRPNRIFTADSSIILFSVGHLKKKTIDDVIGKLIEILRR